MRKDWEPLLVQLVEERYGRLLAHAMLMGVARHDADDLVQDALVSTFAARGRFGSLGQAEQYVRRAIVSRAVDRGRRSGTERSVVAALAARPESRQHAEITPTGLGPDVEAALARLAPKVRACVVLRYLEDLSVRETAALLHLSEGAVKRYVHDGVAILNAALGTTTHENDDDRVVVHAKGDPR